MSKIAIKSISIYLHKEYMSIIFPFSDKKTGRKTCVQVFSNDIIILILKKKEKIKVLQLITLFTICPGKWK